MHSYHNVDVCVAVSTEGGLITPIVRNAEMKVMPESKPVHALNSTYASSIYGLSHNLCLVYSS